MNPAALQAFNAQRLQVQYGMFGQPVNYQGMTYVGCHSAVKNSKSLRDGGFALAHDFICRLRKSDLRTRPLEEKEIIVGGKKYRISEVIDHPLSGEWRLGLRASA